MAACDGENLPVLNIEASAEVAKLRRDLNSGIGANLNQALLHANRAAKVDEAPDETELLRDIRAATHALATLRADLQLLLRPAGRP